MAEPRCVVTRDEHDRAVIVVYDAEDRGEPLKHVVKHSPTGMEFGYGGSGPSDLARSLMIHWFGERLADRYYRDFKAEFVASIPTEGGVITKAAATRWIEDREIRHEVEEGPDAYLAAG